jgi:hypothetical protein
MKKQRFKLLNTILILAILMIACGGQVAGTEPAEGVTSEASVDDGATGATEAPTDSAASTEAPSAGGGEVQHTTIPVNLPEKQSGEALDFDSSKVLSNGTLVGGDRFTFGRFERPFNANTMDMYFSDLDIVATKVFQDDTWIYASVTLKELTASSSANQKYAVEIDANLNGKGDWLIMALKPSSTDWSVNGVQIFQDTNKDVGLDLPYLTDENVIGTSDGFETNVFDAGQGNDPDSAWVRISPNDSNTIEFAIKISAIGNADKYLINMWAGTSIMDPALFDFNDSFTHAQAGAADAGLQVYYPIKEVAEIDNSCRMAVGFQPTGKEAGICVQFIPAGADAPPTSCQVQACTAEYTWNPVTCTCDFSGPK